MDNDRLVRSKKRALAKRAAIVERIRSVLELGTLGESDAAARDKFLLAVDDLTDLWSQFVIENDTVLDVMVDLDEVQDFSNSIELEANNLVISAKSLAKRLLSIEKVHGASSSDVQNVVLSETVDSVGLSSSLPVKPPKDSFSRDSLVRLPEIPLPRFEGNLTDWPLFRDRFVALVDSRSSIANIEKFYYLLNCLGSEASDVVKGITVSNEYVVAWSVLVERYDQPSNALLWRKSL